MMRFNRIVGLTTVALALLFLGLPAQAAFKLELSCPACPTQTITDNGAGDLAPGIPGLIINNAVIGTFTLSSNTGSSKPLIGPPAQLSLNSLNVTATAGSTLTLRLTDTGFTNPAGLATLQNRFTFNGFVPMGTTAMSQGGFSPTNTEFDMSGGTTPPINLNSTASGANSTSGTFNLPATYGLTEAITLTFAGPCSAAAPCSVNLTKVLEVQAVPEPSSVALFGGMLLFTGAFIRRRIRNLSV